MNPEERAPEPERPSTPDASLLGAAAAATPPVFEDAWALLAYARSIDLEDRPALVDAYLRLAAQRPPLVRDSLINAGKDVFNYRVATAREQIKNSAQRSLPQVLRAMGALGRNPDHERLIPLLREAAAVIAPMGSLDTLHAKDEVGEMLRLLGIHDVKLLDAALADAWRAAEEAKGQGKTIRLVDPEPWGEAVDGAALLDRLAVTYTEYVVLPPHAAVTLALWVVLTYVTDVVDTLPIAAIVSPEKRCGKTRLLSVTTALVRKPLAASNITVAALFRTIDKYQPTLIVDEADSFLGTSDEMRGVLNSGHTRDTAYVIRSSGEDHEPAQFSTWGAKMIALIGRLPGTLEDRSITLALRRRLRSEPIKRLRRKDFVAPASCLHRQALRWAHDNGEALREADPAVPEQLHDRAQDNWRSLLAIADLVGGDWPARARAAALALSTDMDDDGDAGSARLDLLADIKAIFASLDPGVGFIWTESLLKMLADIPDSRWSNWDGRNPLSAHGLAGLLKPYGVKSKDVKSKNARQETKVLKGYRRADLVDVFERYLPKPRRQPLPPLLAENAHESDGFPPDAYPLPEAPVAAPNSSVSDCFSKPVAAVADSGARNGGPGEANADLPALITIVTDPATAPRSPFRVPDPRPAPVVVHRPDLLHAPLVEETSPPSNGQPERRPLR